MELYRACERCLEYRLGGNLEACLACRTCNGTGILRNPQTYLCNKCGCALADGYGPSGLVEASVSGGFNSFHLFDLTTYTFSLCEKCLRGMFSDFAIPPAVHDIDGGCTYEQDLSSYVTACWAQDGGRREYLIRGLCNHDEECLAPAVWRLMVQEELSDRACCENHKKRLRSFHGRLVAFGEVPLKAETPDALEVVRRAWEAAQDYNWQTDPDIEDLE